MSTGVASLSLSQRNHIKWFSLVRIAGITLVLIYHFFRDILPGGFFGVDVFFVFSGYLITALIVEEVNRKGNYKFFAFLKRRFVRTFPPLLVAIIFTLPFALLLAPDFVGGIGRQVSAALGFVTNYFEIAGGGSYEAQLLPHLYVHTWSLALEMHYYLLWGLLCAGLVLLVRRFTYKATARQRGAILCGGLVVASLLLTVLCWQNMQALYAAAAANAGDNPVDPSLAYFASTSRAFPFFMGSAVGALFGVRIEGKAGILRKKYAKFIFISVMACSAIGLFAMSAIYSFGEQKTYQYGILLASLLAVALICAARALHEAAPNTREPKALTTLADLSYGVFLAHWPLYVVFSEMIRHNWLAALATLALSLLFAAMILYGVEPQFRGQGFRVQGRLSWRELGRRKQAVYPALAVLCILALAGSVRVLWAAPGVTSLEQGIINGALYQQADRIGALRRQTGEIKPPVDRRHALISGFADAPENASFDDWMPAVAVNSIPGGISFLGDSVSLGANKLLTEMIPDIEADSAASRNLYSGMEKLQEWVDGEALREYVVISLGTNSFGDWQKQIDKMVDSIPAGRRLILVTPFIGKELQGSMNREVAAYYRELAAEVPWITLADWSNEISRQPELLAPDKIHFGNVKACSRIFVDLVLLAIQEAGRKSVK